jgi:hypothetical protein
LTAAQVDDCVDGNAAGEYLLTAKGVDDCVAGNAAGPNELPAAAADDRAASNALNELSGAGGVVLLATPSLLTRTSAPRRVVVATAVPPARTSSVLPLVISSPELTTPEDTNVVVIVGLLACENVSSANECFASGRECITGHA